MKAIMEATFADYIDVLDAGWFNLNGDVFGRETSDAPGQPRATSP